jgi:uncharacterized protein (UPF0297 family)
MDKTVLFDVEEIKSALYAKTLKEIYDSLKIRGYNPINQIVGYLISGDPGYISNFQNAREKMLSLDRSELMAAILKHYMGEK